MPVSLRLAIKQWRIRPLRPIVCILAVLAAVALVQAAGVAFDSAFATFHRSIAAVAGGASLHLRPAFNTSAGGFPPSVEQKLRRLPQVRRLGGRMVGHVVLTHAHASRLVQMVGVDPPADAALRPEQYVAGHALRHGGRQVVLDSTLAAILQAKVGSRVRVVGPDKKAVFLRVVGIYHATALKLILHNPACLVPAPTLAALLNQKLRYHLINVQLRRGATAAAFRSSAKAILGPGASIASTHARQARLGRQSTTIRLTIVALTVSISIAAAFIIGSTLGVGLEERVRQFGGLRCIGASRGQLAMVLAFEALLLMLPGTLLGLLGGTLIAHVVMAHFPSLFTVWPMRLGTIAVAAGCGVFATVVGSLAPLWQLLHVTPMQAVQIGGRPRRSPPLYVAAALGLAMLAAQVLCWQIPQPTVRFWVYIFAGIPLVFFGYALLAPGLLALVAPVAARVCGAVLRVRPELLRSSWSNMVWRATVMIAALMLGAALFCAVRTRGRGLRETLRFPAKFPDLFLYSAFNPVPLKQITALPAAVPNVTHVAGITAFYVKVFLHGPNGKAVTMLFAATQPRRLRSMLTLHVLQGKSGHPFAQMHHRRNVVVGRQAMRRLGLHAGSSVDVPTVRGMRVFHVAAVVDAPGLDMAKRFFHVRGVFHSTAATSMMGSLADAKRYFRIQGANMLLMTTRPGAPQKGTLDQVKSFILRDMRSGLLGTLLKKDLGVQGASSQRMKYAVRRVLNRVITALMLIAVGIIAITGFGVSNLVVAAMYTRRYEFGLLRAVGAGRGQVVRLVLGEVVMLCLVAWVLGGAVGLHLAFMATRVDALFLRLPSKFVVSYNGLWIGLGVTVAVGLVAAALPAWRAATRSQWVLLAGGRG